MSVDDFLSLVAPRVVDYTKPGTVALLPFHNAAVRGALHEAKYHGTKHAFTLLAAALGAYLGDSDELAKRTVILPVPLGRERLRERTYNQVEAVIRTTLRQEELGNLRLEPNVLTRTRETVSQVSLPREKRRENMRGAFVAGRPLDPAYLYIVVDDVITTGATLQAAIDALSAAGATRILPIALAH
jgi:predicted amidophosphoribosyltransferase